MLVKDFMQSKFFTIGSQATLIEAAERLLANRVDTLVVLKEDELLGVIDLHDLFTAPVPAHYGNPMARQDNGALLLSIWKTMPIQELMNEKVISVTEETPLLRAAELMVTSGKHPLPVLRDGKVIGVISRSDIARVLLMEA